MDTRGQILAAALRLFAEQGYDAVGVQAIVDTVAVTKPTLYHYFGSKRGLFEILVREQAFPLVEAVREAAHYEGDLTRSIQKLVRAYFGYAGNHPLYYRMMLSMWFAPPSSEYFPVVQEVLVEQHRLIEAMFREAVVNHGNMQGRHLQYAVSLKGMIDTYIGMSLRGLVRLNDDAFEHRIIHQFMYGIFS